jgi:hypothetical protein
MPWSYPYGKNDVKDYINKTIPKDARIIDCGAGAGTYLHLLKPLGYTLDALEISDGYVKMYELDSLYNKVHIGNIVDFDFSNYDFAILGDILEHLSVADAQKVMAKLPKAIIAIPYMLPQTGCTIKHNDMEVFNPYEKHEQPDLTVRVMFERYPMLELVWSNIEYGYFKNF